MLNNDPKIRQFIYVLTAIVGGIAVVFEGIPAEWAQAVADGAKNLAAYLATLIGVMGATNLTAGGDVKLLESKTTVTRTTLDD